MKKYFKIALWCLVGIFVVYTFVFLYQKSQPKEVVYELLEPSMRDIVKSSVASGKVEPRDEVNLKPKIQGIVTHLYKEPGDYVREGDPIAKIQVIPDMAQLSNAQSNLRTSQLSLEVKEAEFERTETLYGKGVVSKEEYERVFSELAKLREQVQSAEDALDIVTSGISKRAGKINTTVVTSTVSGRILDIPVKVGTTVVNASNYSDGTTIATVADMNDIIFRGNIDETEVGRLHAGMEIVLTIGALQGVKLPAVLEYVAPKGVTNNGAVLFEIKAAATNIPDSVVMRAGYSANAEIVLDKRANVLSVEESAIQFEGDSTMVYRLVSAEGEMPQRFERVPVQVGMSDGLYIEILSGVTNDMKLRGNEKIED